MSQISDYFLLDKIILKRASEKLALSINRNSSLLSFKSWRKCINKNRYKPRQINLEVILDIPENDSACFRAVVYEKNGACDFVCRSDWVQLHCEGIPTYLLTQLIQDLRFSIYRGKCRTGQYRVSSSTALDLGSLVKPGEAIIAYLHADPISAYFTFCIDNVSSNEVVFRSSPFRLDKIDTSENRYKYIDDFPVFSYYLTQPCEDLKTPLHNEMLSGIV